MTDTQLLLADALHRQEGGGGEGREASAMQLSWIDPRTNRATDADEQCVGKQDVAAGYGVVVGGGHALSPCVRPDVRWSRVSFGWGGLILRLEFSIHNETTARTSCVLEASYSLRGL